MSNLNDVFIFDVNWGASNEGIFTAVAEVGPPPVPPIEGYFLELNGGNFLLLNGQDMTLL